MGELPERFADEELNEKQRELLALLTEYDTPDTPLGELEDQTPWSRKTCKKWLDRLEGRGLVRARQLPGQETWMYGTAHEESAYGVPGDLPLDKLLQAREQLRAIAEAAEFATQVVVILSFLLVLDAISGTYIPEHIFNFSVETPLIIAVEAMVLLAGIWYISSSAEKAIEGDATALGAVRTALGNVRARFA
jgi:DNA-binding Lrp family transcriptional regulator